MQFSKMSMQKTFSLIARLSVVEFFLRGAKFLFFVLLANSVTKEIFGDYNYIAAWLAVIFVLSDLGITKRITILVAKKEVRISFLLLVRLVLFIFFAVIALFFVHADILLYILVAAIFLIDSIFEMFFAIYRGSEQYAKEYSTKFIIALLYFFVAIVLWWLKLDIYKAFIVLFGGYVAFLLVHISFVRRYVATPLRIQGSITKENLYLFLALLFTMLYLRIDIIILGSLVDKSSVAEYSVAVKIVEVAMIVPSAISNVFLTKFVKYRTFQGSEFLFQVLAGIVLSLLFMLLAPWIVELFFSRYDLSAYLAQILSVGILFIMINNYIFTKFIAKEQSYLYMWSTLVMFMANLVLNLFFIPLYGIKAAALTTLATEALGSGIAWMLWNHYGRKVTV